VVSRRSKPVLSAAPSGVAGPPCARRASAPDPAAGSAFRLVKSRQQAPRGPTDVAPPGTLHIVLDPRPRRGYPANILYRFVE
jgi:hypothetical protein